MSNGINKVILVGRLGDAPELKSTQSGVAVANVSLATGEIWRDKQTGEKKEKTEWHRIVFFNRLAEIAGEYLKKGSQVYIEGKLQTRKWQDQSGNDRWSTEVLADQLRMLDSRSDDNSNSNSNSNGYAREQPAQQEAATKQQPQAREPDYFDDDIPF